MKDTLQQTKEILLRKYAPELLPKEVDIQKALELDEGFIQEFYGLLGNTNPSEVSAEELQLVATLQQLLKLKGVL